jgi:mRNA interferase YafQ
MTYSITTTKRFDKDVERLIKQKTDLAPLREAVRMLASGERLPERYRDHQLKGKEKGFRECHIKDDWLLKYVKDKNTLVLVLTRTGTHRDLFGAD